MIKIVSVFDRLLGNTTEFVVSSVSDYVDVYELVLNAYEENKDLLIYVQVHAIVHWFNQMSERYPKGTFSFEEFNARIYLETLWGIKIPDTVEPREIVEAGLLELETTPGLGDQFDDFLMGTFYAPIYRAKRFQPTNLVEFLKAYDQEKWNANRKINLIYKVYRERINEWLQLAIGRDLKELINRLDSDPNTLREQITKFKALCYYKALGHRLMREDFSFFENLKLNLNTLKVNEGEIEDVIIQIKFWLNNYDKPTNLDEMLTFISNVSGILSIEFDIIEGILLGLPDLIRTESIDALENKFDSLRQSLRIRIQRLRNRISPEKPQMPNQAWDVGEMLDWATKSYLPYQAWCDENDILDDSLYDISDVFSSWLYENWHTIHTNSNRLVFNVLPNISSYLANKRFVNLILVIDNLGWTRSLELKGIFQKHGFSMTVSEPYISMVPSETEISKKCLLSGASTYEKIDNKSYDKIIEKGWVPYFNQADFRYLSGPGKLKSLKEIDAKTYVVNYLELDKSLHKSSVEIGSSHKKLTNLHLNELVEGIFEFVKKHKLENLIKIHIVSDHGSLRILKQAHNAISPEFFKGDEYPFVSHRYLKVTNEAFEGLPDYLREDCYFLSSPEFGNDGHYLCARKSNRFLTTDGTNYLHGGLSPEEVVVPHLVFEAALEPVQDLTLILVDDQFRYRKETIELKLGNPNSSRVEDIRINCLNSNIEIEPEWIDRVEAERDLTIQMEGLFKQTQNLDERTTLSISVRYEFIGEIFEKLFKFPIEMKTMIEMRDTSMFDDLG